MVRALTSLRDAIDKGAVSAIERATTAVFSAKLRLDQSTIPCAAQGKLREVMMQMIQARDASADAADLRAKIELAVTAPLDRLAAVKSITGYCSCRISLRCVNTSNRGRGPFAAFQ